MTAGAIGLFLYGYYAQVGRGVPTAVALSEAQTMTVTTVVLFQIFYLIECRSLRGSVFESGLLSNPGSTPASALCSSSSSASSTCRS